MKKLQFLDLFSGTGSIAKAAKERGHNVVTVDFDPQFGADIQADVLELSKTYFKGKGFDAIWCSPPCQTFSVAAIGRHYQIVDGVRSPKSEAAKIGLRLLRRTEDIIRCSEIPVWFMENPMGMMRKMTRIDPSFLHRVTYCQYGDFRMKPTDIWTNADWKNPKACKNGDPCHEASPRGKQLGTTRLRGPARGVIPHLLCLEVIKAAERTLEALR